MHLHSVLRFNYTYGMTIFIYLVLTYLLNFLLSQWNIALLRN